MTPEKDDRWGYSQAFRAVTGTIMRGRIQHERHSVLVETATGGVYAETGDLILVLHWNGGKLVLRKEDWPHLIQPIGPEPPPSPPGP